jgi:tRNA A-37 threonylcarbamoyl transferase component Bud32
MGDPPDGWVYERALAGRVVRARRAGLVAALKSTAPGAGWSARAALRREARLLAGVRGEGVGDVLAVIDRRRRTTLVLAFVPAGSLAERPAPDPDRVVRRLEVTVQRLHRAGVAHGALVPEHVVLTAEGDPVLVGFGHARRTTTFTADDIALAGLVTAIRSGA